MTVFCSICIFNYISNSRNIFYLLVAILILILLFVFGFNRIKNNQTIYSDKELRIVHTYIDQKDKWNEQSIDITSAMGSLNKITVFPETSLGYDSNRPKNWIFGYIRKDKNNFFNSINYDGNTYDKNILVPFGEYFPFSNLINLLFFENQFFENQLTRGLSTHSFPSNLSPLICYEIIFPSYVRNSLSDNTNLLVNISNDGWFGDFSGPKQHFTQARFRSIELGIPLVRSSNKGISGLISPLGENLKVTNSQKNTYFDVKIPKKLSTTIYRQYGNLLSYFLIVLFLLIGYAVNIKSRIV